MMYALQFLRKFKKEEKGQALTEYGLIIALVAILLIASLGFLTGALQGIFTTITDAI